MRLLTKMSVLLRFVFMDCLKSVTLLWSNSFCRVDATHLAAKTTMGFCPFSGRAHRVPTFIIT